MKSPAKQFEEAFDRRFRMDPSELKARFKESVEWELRSAIMESVFSPEAKAKLLRSFEVKVEDDNVTVVATDPAFKALLEGQRKQQMRWLTKAGAPIPIETPNGLIWRWATHASMMRGSWVHPGRPKTDVVSKAKAAASGLIRDVMLGRK